MKQSLSLQPFPCGLDHRPGWDFAHVTLRTAEGRQRHKAFEIFVTREEYRPKLCNVQDLLQRQASGKSDDLHRQSQSDGETISLAAEICQLPIDPDVAVKCIPSKRKSKRL